VEKPPPGEDVVAEGHEDPLPRKAKPPVVGGEGLRLVAEVLLGEVLRHPAHEGAWGEVHEPCPFWRGGVFLEVGHPLLPGGEGQGGEGLGGHPFRVHLLELLPVDGVGLGRTDNLP